MTTKTTRRSGMRWTAGIIGARAEKSGCSGSAMSVVLLLAFCRLAVGQLPTQGAVVLRIGMCLGPRGPLSQRFLLSFPLTTAGCFCCVFVHSFVGLHCPLYPESQKRQELYQKMDCDASSFSAEVGPKSTTNTTPSNNNTQVRLDTRHACMCGFLKSLAPAETQLRSQKSGTVAAAAAKCVNGVATIPGTSRQYACSKINLQSFVSLVELNDLYGSPTDRTSDVWGWTDPKSCREFALLGMESGLAIVEITNPFDYTYTGKLPPHDEDSFWRNVKTYRNHAFVVSESPRHGMQVRRTNE